MKIHTRALAIAMLEGDGPKAPVSNVRKVIIESDDPKVRVSLVMENGACFSFSGSGTHDLHVESMTCFARVEKTSTPVNIFIESHA